VKTNPKVQMHLSVPNVVRQNALAVMHTHIYRNEGKLRKIFKEIPDMDKSTQMVAMLDLILTKYGEPPKKNPEVPKPKAKNKGPKRALLVQNQSRLQKRKRKSPRWRRT
jgi:hypothetical protein